MIPFALCYLLECVTSWCVLPLGVCYLLVGVTSWSVLPLRVCYLLVCDTSLCMLPLGECYCGVIFTEWVIFLLWPYGLGQSSIALPVKKMYEVIKYAKFNKSILFTHYTIYFCKLFIF